MDDTQQNFYKRLLINIQVKCLKQGIKKSEFCLKQGRKISDICLKQGQGMRGRAAPPHPGIYRVPPPPVRGFTVLQQSYHSKCKLYIVLFFRFTNNSCLVISVLVLFSIVFINVTPCNPYFISIMV